MRPKTVQIQVCKLSVGDKFLYNNSVIYTVLRTHNSGIYVRIVANPFNSCFDFTKRKMLNKIVYND